MKKWIDFLEFEGYFRYLEEISDQLQVTEFNIEKNMSKDVPTGILNAGEVIVDELVTANKMKVIHMIRQGINDDEVLLKELSNWENLKKIGKQVPITFIGLRITTNCNLYGLNRCKYCDQRRYNGVLNFNRIIDNASKITHEGKIRGIRCVISGGEPLVTGIDELFSKSGLVTKLNDMGFIVSMNSNLHLLSPLMILPIINSGLANIHTSFDSIDEDTHDTLVYKGACKRVYSSLYMFQKIKRILKVQYPLLHINVVATRYNILQFDSLFEELLKIRGDYYIDKTGNPIVNPDLSALSPHLITVGGESNIERRPTKNQWLDFVHITLPRCRVIWNEYLEKNGIKTTINNSFDIVHSSANPFFSSIFERKINYEEKIDKLMKNNSRGDAHQCKKCYLAATQGYVCPNGDVYTCGVHADSVKSRVLGNIYEKDLQDIINDNLEYINNELPNSDLCARCNRSLRNTNAIIEERLKIFIKKWKRSVTEVNLEKPIL